jgi:hypothetical protein
LLLFLNNDEERKSEAKGNLKSHVLKKLV